MNLENKKPVQNGDILNKTYPEEIITEEIKKTIELLNQHFKAAHEKGLIINLEQMRIETVKGDITHLDVKVLLPL